MKLILRIESLCIYWWGHLLEGEWRTEDAHGWRNLKPSHQNHYLWKMFPDKNNISQPLASSPSIHFKYLLLKRINFQPIKITYLEQDLHKFKKVGKRDELWTYEFNFPWYVIKFLYSPSQNKFPPLLFPDLKGSYFSVTLGLWQPW